jgi:hypothetical protein
MWRDRQAVPKDNNIHTISVVIQGKNKKGEKTTFKNNYVYYDANQIVGIIRKYLCNDTNRLYDEYLKSLS